MELSIYVHEFRPEVGHSRAMIELLNSLASEKKDKITSIEVIAYETSPLEEILKDFKCSKKITRIPFKNIKPFLLKALFYNIVTIFHSLFLASNRKKIGIGIACWKVDIVNVQFIHKQWEKLYFNSSSMDLFKKLYKKILFLFFSFGENIVYRQKKIEFIAIANFIKLGLIDHFNVSPNSISLIPSGVNCNEFNFSQKSSNELINYLKEKYLPLRSLDPLKPIVLFVGAYERKGLDKAIKALENEKNYQFIIIGKPEHSSSLKLKHNPNHFFINFTNEVNLFYELSDIFIFPTRYEPFGLVIIEAYIMGLDIIIPKENVGASEIIPASDGVLFISQNEEIEINCIEKVSQSKKRARRELRLEIIKSYSWNNAGRKFQSMLFKE